MPRSLHVDRFNHDQQASSYDRRVLNEADPIRAGYAACLEWVAQQATLNADCTVLELGTGTGNLTERLRPYRRLVCVDVSEQMLRQAQTKLLNASFVTWMVSDLLEFFDRSPEAFDRVVSTFAIHHLTDEEKHQLFSHVDQVLSPGGLAVFGDLMFENEQARIHFIDECRRYGRDKLVDDVANEFFWNLESVLDDLESHGLRTTVARFSELSWGIAARKG